MDLDERIAQWRSFVAGRPEGPASIEGVENDLCHEIEMLTAAGLRPDEAFVIALRRVGASHDATREFVRMRADLLLGPAAASSVTTEPRGIAREPVVIFGLAIAAAFLVKLPEAFGHRIVDGDVFYARNLNFFVLPLLTGYFAWKRDLDAIGAVWAAVWFVVSAVVINTFPFVEGSHTQALAALHLPIAMWAVVGVAFAGGDWRSGERRLEFVRFTGELFIYLVLIALGGMVLTLLTIFMFDAIGIRVEPFVQRWLLPCGSAGGFIVAAWLTDTKRTMIGNIVPMLARIFTPLFAVALLAFLGAMLWTRSGIEVERNVLIGFDLLLVLVVAIHLYTVSSRDTLSSRGFVDGMQLLLLASALFVDLAALAAIAARISEFGFSPNKTAALGLNLILLINLAWSAKLYLGFLRGSRPFGVVERWQTTYLPAYVVWAATVVVVFPLIFAFA